jgi:YidC/Oxa1 family membrane protein insertase
MILQIPVFFGLNNVLRGFHAGGAGNYFFGPAEVDSYMHADLFGARLSNYMAQKSDEITALGADHTSIIIVSIPLMIIASIATHLTARHNIERQNPATATAQTGIMNKITMYVFPLGVLVFGAFFPIGLLFYWLSNNFWTLGQQRLIYKKIDREEEEKKTQAVEKRNALGPKPGQKPTQPKKRPATAKPVTDTSADDTESTTAESASKPAAKPAGTKPAAPKGTGAKPPAKPAPGAKPVVRKKPPVTRKQDPAATDRKQDPAPNTNGATEVSGLSSDRSASKKSGRKRP